VVNLQQKDPALFLPGIYLNSSVSSPRPREHIQFLPKTHKALQRKALWTVFSFEQYYTLDVQRAGWIDV